MLILVFLLGLVIGSFLNSCIYRLPRGVSIIYPPSFCPSCGHKLYWRDLIPIISYLVLGGKCKYCGVRIPLRYPFIEFLTGVIFLLSYYEFGFSYDFLFSSIFLILLEFIAIIDLKHHEVMDSAVYLGIGVGIGFYALKSGIEGLFFSLEGVIYGAGIIALIFYVSNGGIGEGDIGVAAFIGAWLGSFNTIVALFIAFIIGGFFAIFLLTFSLKKWGERIPFAPFLAIGGATAFFKGSLLIEFYWGVLR